MDDEVAATRGKWLDPQQVLELRYAEQLLLSSTSMLLSSSFGLSLSNCFHRP